MNGPVIDEYTETQECKKCRRSYTKGDYVPGQERFCGHPYWYDKHWEEYCLECFLGVGPDDE